jgi:hypothetical protein
MLVCAALEDAFFLGVLSSRVHAVWVRSNAAPIGVYKGDVRYTKSRTFDPFPFPAATEAQKSAIRAAAEELDALRKRAQVENPGLTLTQIYNVLEKLRAGETLDADDEAIKAKGLVLIVKELHDKIDALVAQAYGWPSNLSDEEILQKLVALNAERAAEEKRGLIRWLRPDYQMKRAGIEAEAAPQAKEEQLEAPLVAAAAKEQKPSFPTGDLERTAAVFDALMSASAPLEAQTIAKAFPAGRQGRTRHSPRPGLPNAPRPRPFQRRKNLRTPPSRVKLVCGSHLGSHPLRARNQRRKRWTRKTVCSSTPEPFSLGGRFCPRAASPYGVD